MKRILLAICLAGLTLTADAEDSDDLNVQFHGYATQGFIYTSANNWNTTTSADGSADWTEAVVNLSTSVAPRLSIGVQTRYLVLGDYGNSITLDWARVDYKRNESFGIRAGKVKTPTGLFNETQDIDPSLLWILLPQSVYPIASRTTLLSHFGTVLYGSIPLGARLGKLEYRAFGGEQIVDPKDGVLQPERDAGLSFPGNVSGMAYGGTLHWRAPIAGLLFGASMEHEHHAGSITSGMLKGNFDSGPFVSAYYYARYEHKQWMLAGEYNRFPPNPTTYFPGRAPSLNPSDARNWYAMTSWRFNAKFTAGTYYSYSLDLKAPKDQNRYQKDWTLSARYDFNPFLYLKAEQHLVNGTAIGFSSLDNGDGLQTRFNMTLLKVGTSF